MNIFELREAITPFANALIARESKDGMLPLFPKNTPFLIMEALDRAIHEDSTIDSVINEIEKVLLTGGQLHVKIIREDIRSLLEVVSGLDYLWSHIPHNGNIAERNFRLTIVNRLAPYVRKRLRMLGLLQDLTID